VNSRRLQGVRTKKFPGIASSCRCCANTPEFGVEVSVSGILFFQRSTDGNKKGLPDIFRKAPSTFSNIFGSPATMTFSGFRPVALRHRLSATLPFRMVRLYVTMQKILNYLQSISHLLLKYEWALVFVKKRYIIFIM